MRTKWNILLVLVSAVLLGGCTLPFLQANPVSKWFVNPQANIYLDGRF
jgi:hypothetical protein